MPDRGTDNDGVSAAPFILVSPLLARRGNPRSSGSTSDTPCGGNPRSNPLFAARPALKGSRRGEAHLFRRARHVVLKVRGIKLPRSAERGIICRELQTAGASPRGELHFRKRPSVVSDSSRTFGVSPPT